MKQFILNDGAIKDGKVRLTGRDYRYLVQVRRLAPGEYFPAILPDGTEAAVRVCSVGNHAVTGEIAQRETGPDPALPPVILFQALPKGDKMDLIIRQAAEGGLAEIVPFISEFSMMKQADRSRLKLSRWERIIKEARQQSGSATATSIRQPVSIDSLFSYWDGFKGRSGTLGILFHHLPLANESIHHYLSSIPTTVVLTIGPEGGFSPAEAERFLAAGFKPFMVKGTILRTETAALYAQAAVRVLLLEKDSWVTK